MPDGGSGPDSRPALILVVDTEEEFDWSAPFDRARTGVGHMRAVERLQAVCEPWGLRPVYVVTWPIVDQPAGAAALRPLLRSGRALVGAHLHPWVTPPHLEEVNERNSYPGNLPAELEREKLGNLLRRIETALDAPPRIYKAGRYGVGPNTFAILEELGIPVDVSPAPPFNYSDRHGPDYSARGVKPRWEGPDRRVLSIPGTGALIGPLANPTLYALARQGPLARLRLGSVLSRSGLLQCVKLSPEGYSAADMQALVRWLYARGERLFMLTLHSPSLEPGHTPYVRSEAQLQDFLGSLTQFLRFFMTELNGRPTDPLAVHAAAQPEFRA